MNPKDGSHLRLRRRDPIPILKRKTVRGSTTTKNTRGSDVWDVKLIVPTSFIHRIRLTPRGARYRFGRTVLSGVETYREGVDNKRKVDLFFGARYLDSHTVHPKRHRSRFNLGMSPPWVDVRIGDASLECRCPCSGWSYLSIQIGVSEVVNNM